jgi:hypothetical protein
MVLSSGDSNSSSRDLQDTVGIQSNNGTALDAETSPSQSWGREQQVGRYLADVGHRQTKHNSPSRSHRETKRARVILDATSVQASFIAMNAQSRNESAAQNENPEIAEPAEPESEPEPESESEELADTRPHYIRSLEIMISKYGGGTEFGLNTAAYRPFCEVIHIP